MSGGILFRWLHRWRIASRLTSSDSANRESRISSIAFTITCGTSTLSLTKPASLQHSLFAQDWGTGLAFHLAARRPEFIRGLAFMEFIRPIPSWDDLHGDAVETFKKFRTPGVGEKMILEDNVFVERMLPAAIGTKADGRGNVSVPSSVSDSEVAAAHLALPQ
jgi:pimeloyl-ACP methyl ester carboxylesterase